MPGEKVGVIERVEAAIAVKHRGIVAVFLETLPIGQEHRHLCSIFALIENLFGGEVVGLEVDFRAEERRALAALEIVAVNGRWLGETHIGIECLGVLALPSEPARRAQSRKLDLARGFSGNFEELDRGMRVLEVTGDKAVADQLDAFQFIGRFRHHRGDVLGL